MPTKTDPATNLPLTDAEVATAWDATMGAVTGRDAYFNWPFLPEPDRFRARAFARAAYALAASRVNLHAVRATSWDDGYDAARAKYQSVDTAEVERRAARKAWDAAHESTLAPRATWDIFRDAYLAREYPAPAPRECVLSDGSVVTRHDDPRHVWGGWWRRAERDATDSTGWTGTRTWPELMRSSDTGADFDALKRFAAEVGQ